MKRKWLITMLLVAALSLLAGVALAATDPVVCDMEISPEKLSAPGTVNVTITISNSGSTDMKDPVVLYNPVGQKVEDFGTDGAYTLKAGETKTWTGTWDVNQRTLDSGTILFYIKYTLYSDSGKAEAQSTPIRAKIEQQSGEPDIEIKRTISPGAARDGQTVSIKYDISNTGAVSLLNVTIQENNDINKTPQTIPELKAGEKAEVKFQVTMGKKDLTSSATVSYQTADSKKASTKEVEAQTIVFGEPAMNAKLTSSAKGVAINEQVTLTLELENNGNVDYSDLRVSDPTLGDVFTNQSLAQGGSLKLEKEITLPETTEYQFTITAIDNTGTEVSLSTDPLTVTAMDPNKVLHLDIVTTPDRTEVFEQPGKVRFSISVTNDSEVDAKEVDIIHGKTTIYTFSEIPAGTTRTLTRDAALSMAGKYQFSATTKDEAENTVTFNGNEIQIAFSVPTPAPETPTPPPQPTDVPVFVPLTMPPIRDESIGAVPKTIQNILLPILIISGVVLIASTVLLLIASKRRAEQKKASESAYDHLERSKRRDYAAPSVPPEEEVEKQPAKEKEKRPTKQRDTVPSGKKRPGANKPDREDVPLDDVELPHMKYVRSAMERGAEQASRSTRKPSSLFDDEDLYGSEADGFSGIGKDAPQYGDDAYDDGYATEPYGSEIGEGAAYDDGYVDDYSSDASYARPERIYDDGYGNDDYDNSYATEYDADGYDDGSSVDEQYADDTYSAYPDTSEAYDNPADRAAYQGADDGYEPIGRYEPQDEETDQRY